MGVEAEVEEEPMGETTVGQGREDLRPPGMNSIFFQINILSPFPPFSFGCIWTAFPLSVVFFTSGALWSLGEPKEDEGETEEPEVSTREQFKFTGFTPGRREVHMHWQRMRLKGYLLRYIFPFPNLLLS